MPKSKLHNNRITYRGRQRLYTTEQQNSAYHFRWFHGQTETPDSPDGSSGVFPVPHEPWTEVRVPFGSLTIHPFSAFVNTIREQIPGNLNAEGTPRLWGAFCLCAVMRLSTTLLGRNCRLQCYAAREEGVSYNLRSLASCEGVGRSEVRPVLVVTRLGWCAARIPVHYSRPVDE